MTNLGIITIGRNEGDRLRRCLASIVGQGVPVVYVDSRSTDGSPELARSLGAQVVHLDMSVPFSAARARNEGFDRLMRIAPETRLVFFLDGDCQVVPGWMERAVRELDSHPDAAVVCGRRREQHPEHSVYNRLADLEWDTPIGRVKSCGGDAVFRVEAFRQVNGYDASVVAGEEPELCQRMREKGWTIYRIDAEMTLHDSAMLRFGQWWKRAVRSGYGAMDVATRFRRGPDGLFARQVNSARLWAIGWPLSIAGIFLVVWIGCGIVMSWRMAGAFAAIAALAATFSLPVQMLRLAWRARKRVNRWRTAIAYGILTMISKWANVIGQMQFCNDRRAGRYTRTIDYKNPSPLVPSPSGRG